MHKTIKHLIFFILLLIFVFPKSADAYLDPGTGSYLLQIMTAAFFGGIFLVTAWWKQVKNFIRKIFFRKDKKLSEKSSESEK